MAPLPVASVDWPSLLHDVRILLVEDDPWVRNSLSIFLAQRGCQLRVCESAEEGMECLRKESFRVILCDYRLPGLDGLVLLRFAKEIRPEAKRVLITAYPAGDMVEEAERIGIDDFIQKPFSAEAIEESLARCLDDGD